MGVLVGLWNGTWVARLGVPAFVATLGGMLAFRGASLAVSGVEPFPAYATRSALRSLHHRASIVGVPCPGRRRGASAAAAFRQSGAAETRHRERLRRVAGVLILGWTTLSYRGLPMPVAITLVLAVIMSWSLRNLVWGRHAYAIGGNRDAARGRGHQCCPSNHHWLCHHWRLDGGGRRPLRRPARCCSARNRLFSRAQRDIGGGDRRETSMAAAAPYQAFSWARC